MKKLLYLFVVLCTLASAVLPVQWQIGSHEMGAGMAKASGENWLLSNGTAYGVGTPFDYRRPVDVTAASPQQQSSSPTFQVSKDAKIYSGAPTTNYGTTTDIWLYTGIGRGVIGFNISDIPAGATITSATLYLYYYGWAFADPKTKQVDIYECTQHTWTEAGVTWNKYDGAGNWSTAGGDYTGAAASTTFPAAAAWMSWNITSIASDAYTNHSGLVDLIIKFTTESSTLDGSFYSKEYVTDTTKRPYLAITFTRTPSVPANYKVPIDIHRGSKTVEDGTWIVNSKTYNYRVPFTVHTHDALAAAYPLKVVVDTKTLVTGGFFGASTATYAKTVEWTDNIGTLLYYWATEAGADSPDNFNTTGTIYYVRLPSGLQANTDYTMYMYVDPDITPPSSSSILNSDDFEWGTEGQSLSVSGGNITWTVDSGNVTISTGAETKIEAFISSTIWTVPTGVTSVNVLVVGGGGAGGCNQGGGGGAGGILSNSSYPVVAGTPMTITVGAGGLATSSQSTKGGSGGSSIFGNLTALGGGGGGSYSTSAGVTGGSGGGGAATAGTAGSGTAGQGYAGYAGTTNGGGGGGGKSAAATGKNGANGVDYSATFGTTYGASGWFGGGGGASYTGSGGTGGTGGGGAGAKKGNYAGTAGTANTGGGGGGSGANGYLSGAGGKGIVLVKYTTAPPKEAKFAGNSSTSVARFPVATSGDYALIVNAYKGDNCGDAVLFQHGNGTKRIYVYVDVNENIIYDDGSAHDTGYNVVPSVSFRLAVNNINWAAGTYNINFNYLRIATGATMQTSASDDGIWKISNLDTTVGDDLYIKDVTVSTFPLSYYSPDDVFSFFDHFATNAGNLTEFLSTYTWWETEEYAATVSVASSVLTVLGDIALDWDGIATKSASFSITNFRMLFRVASTPGVGISVGMVDNADANISGIQYRGNSPTAMWTRYIDGVGTDIADTLFTAPNLVEMSKYGTQYQIVAQRDDSGIYPDQIATNSLVADNVAHRVFVGGYSVNTDVDIDWIAVMPEIEAPPYVMFPDILYDKAGVVFLDDKCLHWPYDIAFTDNDGSTTLKWWLDPLTELTKQPGDSIQATVRVTDALSGNATVYIYYGHSSITSTQADCDPEDTYDTFYDFTDITNWTDDAGYAIADVMNPILYRGEIGNVGGQGGRLLAREASIVKWGTDDYRMMLTNAMWEESQAGWPVPFRIYSAQSTSPTGDFNPAQLSFTDGDLERLRSGYWQDAFRVYGTKAYEIYVATDGFKVAYCDTSSDPGDPASWTINPNGPFINTQWLLDNGGVEFNSATNVFSFTLTKKDSTYYIFFSAVMGELGHAGYVYTTVAPENWATDSFTYGDWLIDDADWIEDADIIYDSVSGYWYWFFTHAVDNTFAYYKIIDAKFPGVGTSGGDAWAYVGTLATIDPPYGISKRSPRLLLDGSDWYLYYSSAGLVESGYSILENWIPNWISVNKATTGWPTPTWIAQNTEKKYKQATTTGYQKAYITASAETDFEIISECQLGSAATNRATGILFRYNSTNDAGYVAWLDRTSSADTHVNLYKFVGATYTELGTAYEIPQFPEPWLYPGYPWRLRVQCYGSTIKVAYSAWGNAWVETHSLTDSTYLTGKVGVETATAEGYFNNFRVRGFTLTEPVVGQAAAEQFVDITLDPTSKAFGTVTLNTTYYSIGLTPSFPLADGNCTFSLTNEPESIVVDVLAQATDFVGGTTITLVSGSPGANEARLTLLETGAGNSTDGLILTTSPQEFVASLATGAHTHWELKLEIGTYTSYVEHTGNITFTTDPAGDTEVVVVTFTPEAPDISNTPSSHDFGVVQPSSVYSTGLDNFTLTNNSSFAVDVSISAGNATGGTQWTLSDTATPGSNIFGMKAGVFDSSLDGNWTVKSSVPTDASGWSLYRKIARDSTGVLYTVYHRIATKRNIFISYSNDDGQTWTEEQITSDASYDQWHPAIAIDSDDNIHLSWYGKHSGSTTYTQIRYIKGTIGSWGEIGNLTSDGYTQSHPSIAIDSNNYVHIVWYGKHAGSTTYNQIRYIKYTDSWQAIENLTSSLSQIYANIAIDGDDHVHVVWVGVPPGGTYSQVRYVEYTESWGEIQTLTSEDWGQDIPSIAIDSSNHVHITWFGQYAGSTSYAQIRYITYNGAWSTIQNLTSGDYDQYDPMISIDLNNDIHIIWWGVHAGSPVCEQVRHISYAGSWSEIENITEAVNTQGYPNIIWARWPVVSGLRPNTPASGFVFVWVDDTTLTYYQSSDLEWDSQYDIVVKQTPTYNWLAESLAAAAHIHLGIELLTPTNDPFSDGIEKTILVTLAAEAA